MASLEGERLEGEVKELEDELEAMPTGLQAFLRGLALGAGGYLLVELIREIFPPEG